MFVSEQYKHNESKCFFIKQVNYVTFALCINGQLYSYSIDRTK